MPFLVSAATKQIYVKITEINLVCKLLTLIALLCVSNG